MVYERDIMDTHSSLQGNGNPPTIAVIDRLLHGSYLIWRGAIIDIIIPIPPHYSR
jgi:hypothetical protein